MTESEVLPVTGGAEERFQNSELATSPASGPLANYVPIGIYEQLAWTAGHGPLDSSGTPQVTGTLGIDVSVEDGVRAARLATSNMVVSLHAALGTLDRVSAVCELRGYLRCAPGFDRQEEIMAGATQVLSDLFGLPVADRAPTIVSVTECVLGLTVTIDAVFALDERKRAV